MCCEALTAECMACAEGISVEDYCKKNSSIIECISLALSVG